LARVAFITTSYPSYAGDPSGHFVELEAKARVASGDSVVVIRPGSPTEHSAGLIVEELPGGGCFGWPGALSRLRTGPHRAFGAATFVLVARRRIQNLGSFDAIVAHWAVPSGYPIACAGEGPLEVVVHGSDARLLLRLPRFARSRIVDRLLSRGATFRFVSRALRDMFLAVSTPKLAERSSVLPCPVDVSDVPPRAEARARFGIGDDETVAVVVGRLVSEKRPVEAVKMALERAPDRVVVVGDGPLRSAVSGVDRRVVAIGLKPHADALAWISAADVLVSASQHEGAPTAIREARALGVPVLATPCGDLEEWATNDSGIEIVQKPHSPNLRDADRDGSVLKSKLMSSETARRARADQRRATATIRRGTLQREELDLSPVRGADAITLVTRLTREAWSLSGSTMPAYTRNSVPWRFVPGRPT
jgi:glycosyltransferase involved in cell wall biosynthesis